MYMRNIPEWRERCGSRSGRVRRAAAAAAAAAALAAALAGCGGAGAKDGGGAASGRQTAAGPLAQASGQVQALYQASCQSCHGADLAGRAGPVTNLQHVGSRLTQEQIAAQITRGGGNMPGFGAKLKPDEIAALAAWLAAVK
jgi:cytochrome c551